MPSKRQNPLDEFVIHGVKTVGDYDYYLLVDATGNCYIERMFEDDDTSEYMFCKMATPAVNTYTEIATAINSFWSDPADASKVYGYIFQID